MGDILSAADRRTKSESNSSAELALELARAQARIADLEALVAAGEPSSATSAAIAPTFSDEVIDALEDTVFIFDPITGKALRWNRAFQRVSGYTDDEIATRKAPDDWYSEEDLQCAEAASEALLRGERVTIEMALLTKDGGSIPTEYCASLLKDEQGNPGLFVAIGRDVTERKRTEAALRQGEERYRSLYTRTPIMLHSIDSEGLLISVSEQWLERLGYDRAEVVGRKSSDFLTEESRRSAVEEVLPDFFATGVCLRVPYEFVAKNGEVVEVLLSAIAEKNDAGEVVRSMAVLQDVTEARQLEREKSKLEEQFLQAQKMEAVGRLAGGIAHDFNNLLTGISGHAELAQRGIDNRTKVSDSLQEILEASKRASNLTHQLLAFSRKQLIQPRVIDLNEVIFSINKMLMRILGEEVELTSVLKPHLGRIKADPGQVEQIVVNLAVNARDAMPGGGRLTIETSEATVGEPDSGTGGDALLAPGDYVVLVVSDTGTGMDRETRRRVFEPFFTTRSEEGGSGLGLATVYGIAQRHGGQVEVFSDVGEGTTFKIWFPRVVAAAEPLALDPDHGEMPRGCETVLVVEDDAMVRSVVVGLLDDLGYTVLSSGEGRQAIQLAKQQDGPIDLLITDVVMPGMNGREVALAVREQRPEAKVLFTSGYDDRVIADHGVVDDSLEFISKPYALAELAAKVRIVLDADTAV